MQWLITGCSTGLGLEIARAVLEAGQQCITTSRNPSGSPDAVKEIEQLGGVWATLDVSTPTLESDIRAIVQKHGAVDVVVNNAGYADGGALETMDLNAARQLFEVNFWGSVRVIQALVPFMRERKSGTIVNISSATYWAPPPGAGMYAATKFAMEAVSEALAGELASFNVRVLTIQPGGMKTSFYEPGKMVMPAISEAYKGTAVEYVLQYIAGLGQNAAQDPKKTASAIVKEVLEPCSNPPVSRMPLGKESIEGVRKRMKEGKTTIDRVESVAATCDF